MKNPANYAPVSPETVRNMAKGAEKQQKKMEDAALKTGKEAAKAFESYGRKTGYKGAMPMPS